MDGVAPHMREVFNIYDEKSEESANVVQVLKDAKAQVLVNYLPVGSREATRFYAHEEATGFGLLNAATYVTWHQGEKTTVQDYRRSYNFV